MTEDLATYVRLPAEDMATLTELAGAVGVPMLIKVARAVLRGERDHPVFADSFSGAVTEVKSELLEWESKAIVGRREDSEAEALDSIAVLFRFIRRDYEKGQA